MFSCTSIGYAQSLSFEAINPGEICNEAYVNVLVVNDTGAPIVDSKIEIRLYCGAEYILGTVEGGEELNTNNLPQPTFSLSNLNEGERRSLTLKFKNSCLTRDCIDSGDDMTISAIWNVGADNYSIVSPSLNIKTANLLFTGLSNTYVELVETNRFERIMKIKNTRLGSVNAFTISESYNRAGYSSIIVGADKIDSIPGYNAYLIDEQIISQFGDGDDLFEFGEEIVLVNKVLMDICPFDVQNVGCEFSLEWGCDLRRCQAEKRKCRS